MRAGPWVLALVLISICAAVLGGVWKWRTAPIAADELGQYLPGGESLVVSVDLAAMRQAGLLDLLAGSAAEQEADYREFVERTGFDYRTDLDRALIAVRGESVFGLMVGRFDWNVISGYAEDQQAMCRSSFCRMVGSRPGHTVSFFPLRKDILALASSTDEWAAFQLQKNPSITRPRIGPEPIVVLVPKRLLTEGTAPEMLRPWIAGLGGAEQARLALDAPGGRFELRLRVRCAGEANAATLESRVREQFGALRDAVMKNPNPDQLSLMLSGGEFGREGNEMTGKWAMSRSFIEGLLRAER
jgi:hypothetical protein